MWHDDVEDDDWQPLRSRRAGSIRIIALLIAAAMVLTLVIPVLLRILRSSGEEPDQPGGVRALSAQEVPPGTIAA